jgi:hypothetical protein
MEATSDGLVNIVLVEHFGYYCGEQTIKLVGAARASNQPSDGGSVVDRDRGSLAAAIQLDRTDWVELSTSSRRCNHGMDMDPSMPSYSSPWLQNHLARV